MLDRNLAIEIASRSQHPRHRHAAIIFLNGEIIAAANNRGASHAEIRAIEVAKIQLGNQGFLLFNKQMTLISIAITKDGQLKLGKPCRKCQVKLRYYEIGNVLYSTLKQTLEKLEMKSKGVTPNDEMERTP